MLPKHCKLIKALNIYYMTAGGLQSGTAREGKCAGERNASSQRFISMIPRYANITIDDDCVHACREDRKKFGQALMFHPIAINAVHKVCSPATQFCQLMFFFL